MTKLTASHLAILASACGRDDGIAVSPSDLKPAAAAKAGARLVALALAREIRAKGDMPAWREDEQGRGYSLKILKAGRMAVQAMMPLQREKPSIADPGATVATVGFVAVADHRPPMEPQGSAAKACSKRALILALLNREDGVTIDDLMAATGWLPHTTRAALSVLRKSGLAIVRTRDAGADVSVYRIEPGLVAATA